MIARATWRIGWMILSLNFACVPKVTAQKNQPRLLDPDHFSGVVFCVARQADGRILVGGQFDQIGRTKRANLARLNTDGSVDATFNPGVYGTVRCLLAEPDGKIVVGGQFSGIAGAEQKSLARLNADGRVDPSLQAPAGLLGWVVYTVLPQKGGQLLVGGSFLASGNLGPNLTRLKHDGSVDATFRIAPNNIVTCLAPASDGGVWVGGGFDKIGDRETGCLVHLLPDGRIDPASPKVSGWVAQIMSKPDGGLLAAGIIKSVGDQSTPRMIQLRRDGALDAAFTPDLYTQEILRFALQSDGKLLVALRDDGNVVDSTARYLLRLSPNGRQDPSYPVRMRFGVLDFFMMSGDRCLIAGTFTDAGRLFDRCGGVAIFSPDGKPDEAFNPLGDARTKPTAKQVDRALLQAASEGNQAQAQTALAMGADPNCYSENGWTPLIMASRQGNAEMIRLLVKKGADVNLRSTSAIGSSPLLFAVGMRNRAAAEALVASGAGVNFAGRDGQTPLCMAAFRADRDGAEWLLSKGARLDLLGNEDSNGVRHPPLTVALIGGQILLAEFLLAQGASIEATNSNGDTPLRHMAMAPSVDGISFLLERGARIDGRRDSGHTALMLAAINNQVENVQLLLAKGADPTLKASRVGALKPGETGTDDAETFANRFGFERVADMLRKAKSSFIQKR